MVVNKGCGRNTNHTTGFHGKLHSQSNCPNSPMIKENIPDMHTQPPPSQVPLSTSTDVLVLTLTEDEIVINKYKWKSVL